MPHSNKERDNVAESRPGSNTALCIHICNNIGKLYLLYQYNSVRVVIIIIVNNNNYYIRGLQLYSSQNYYHLKTHWNNYVLIMY